MDNSNKKTLEKKVIKSLKKGEVTAFKDVFTFYQKRLYYFVFSFTKSEYISEEIIQEIFIKIWEDRKQIDLKKSFHAYLFVLAKNKTFNYLRDVSKRESVKKELWNNISKQYEQIESNLIYSEYEDIVEDIVKSFPQTERSVYRLSIEEGKKNSEIAYLLGLQEKTVRNHLWKTKQAIKAQLQPYISFALKLFLLYFVILNYLKDDFFLHFLCFFKDIYTIQVYY